MAKRRRQSWLNAPNVSVGWILAAATITTIVLYFLQKTQFGHDADAQLARPLEFRIRESMGKSPVLDPRIKVLAMDDAAVSFLGAPTLDTWQWSTLLAKLVETHPSAILIDAMFTLNPIPPDQELAVKANLKAIKASGVPIFSGASILPNEIPYRDPLPLSRMEYQMPFWAGRAELGHQWLDQLVPWRNKPLFVYGADANFREIFSGIGHIMYFGLNDVRPFFRVSENSFVPQLAMLAATDRQVTEDGLVLNGVHVPLLSSGEIPVNFLPYKYALQKSKSMKPVFDRLNDDKPLTGIEAGDFVYVIPLLYTGNTDFKSTPFGDMPGAYVHLAVLNSILKGEWLRPVNSNIVLLGLWCASGALVAYLFSPIWVGIFLLLGSALALGVVLYLFAFQDLVFSWLFPFVGYYLTALAVTLEKLRNGDRKAQFIRNALDGSVSEGELENLAKNPQQLNFDARERVVTIMFIDIVGFSLVAENQIPRVAFEHLKTTFAGISKLVHQYGGIVNKNLGDGLLCFFGYSLERDQSTLDHAEKAVACAIEIQRENLQSTIVAFNNSQPVYPLRIGLNTASVYLGNLGTEQKIDFTVVGNGVNFAKRLEGACDIHSVMISSTTRALVDPLGLEKGSEKRMIHIKHHSEMMEAFSFDPFIDDPALKLHAMECFHTSTKQIKVRKRWTIERPENIVIMTNVGQAMLVNFSQSGCSVRLAVPLLQGSTVRMDMDSLDGKLKPELDSVGLVMLEAEVRWSYLDGDTYLHGLKLKNLPESNSQPWVDALLRHGTNRAVVEEQNAEKGYMAAG